MGYDSVDNSVVTRASSVFFESTSLIVSSTCGECFNGGQLHSSYGMMEEQECKKEKTVLNLVMGTFSEYSRTFEHETSHEEMSGVFFLGSNTFTCRGEAVSHPNVFSSKTIGRIE